VAEREDWVRMSKTLKSLYIYSERYIRPRWSFLNC
jgi:hypothetical protein